MNRQTQPESLTAPGYWAMLHDAGIEKLYRVRKTLSWMARNRHGSHFMVRDPEDLSPDQRRDIAADIIGLHGN